MRALLGRGRDQHGLALGRAHEVAVAGVAGVGHQDLVARVDQRQAGKLQSRRGACGNDDAPRRHVNAKALGIPAADVLTQCVQAQRRGVLRQAGAYGAVGGLLNEGRGGEVGLADVQEDHRVVASSHFACQGLCGLGDFHHVERFDALGACGQFHR
ncbi:hypothetical protein SDC9_199983 [bioreactor metagenome]|uniref:Uncharacterized protein n=1 Tax=bioreactor metagenome TaxID=1076179 RepID=A0A645IM41_9ZZZZ